MTIEATVVVEFGKDVDSNSLVVIELDDVYNVDVKGNLKSSFNITSDSAFISIHLQPGLTISPNIKRSSGNINSVGIESRSKTQRMEFKEINETQDFPYFPSGGFTYEWFGNQPVVSSGQRTITTIDNVPGIADVSASVSVHIFELIPPRLVIADDETYPILCVFTIMKG